MNAVYWSAIYLFDLCKLSLILFLLLSLPFKRKAPAALLLIALGAVLVAFGTLWVTTGRPFMLVFWAIVISVTTLLTGSAKRALLILPVYLLVNLIDNLLSGAILYLSGGTQPLLAANSSYYLILNFTILLFDLALFGLLTWAAGKLHPTRTFPFSRRYIGIVSAGLAVLLLITMLIQHEVNTSGAAYGYLFGTVGPALFLLVYLAVCTLVLLTASKAQRYKQSSDTHARLLALQQSYYTTLLEKEAETRRFRHDMSHHIHYVQRLCQTEKWPAIEPYLTSLSHGLSQLKHKADTGNDTLNMVTAQMLSGPEAAGIELQWQGLFPSECKIADTDLCVLFSNLLANAIEATSCTEGGRCIQVAVRSTAHHLYVCMKNPTAGPVYITQNQIKTSKKDAAAHGYGTVSVQRIAAEYGGEAIFSCTNGQFTCELFFPLSPQHPNGHRVSANGRHQNLEGAKPPLV